MTNYDWLCKEGKLTEFISDCRSRLFQEFATKYEGLSALLDASINKSSGISVAIASWLQAEHCELYIKATDVDNAIKKARYFDVSGNINETVLRNYLSMSDTANVYKDGRVMLNTYEAEE